MRYGHLVLYAAILAVAWGFVRPGSKAGRAVTAVSDSFAGVLGKGLAAIGG